MKEKRELLRRKEYSTLMCRAPESLEREDYTIGGAIHGHPMGPWVGAMAMRQAIDATLKGIFLEDASREHKELKAAIEKWGIYFPTSKRAKFTRYND